MEKIKLLLLMVLMMLMGALAEERRNSLELIPFQVDQDLLCLIPADAELVETDRSVSGCFYYIGGKKHFSAGYAIFGEDSPNKGALKI